MKKFTKALIATTAAVPLIGLATVGFASAASSTTGTNWRDSFAQAFATKFNLNVDDVKSFMTEQRTARQAEEKQQASDALKVAGFTDEQITALQNKQDELQTAGQTWRDANPNATRAEMKAHMDEERTALETWATEQGIDLTKVRDTLRDAGVRGMRLGMMGGGMGRGHGMGMMDDGGTPPDAPNDSNSSSSANN